MLHTNKIKKMLCIPSIYLFKYDVSGRGGILDNKFDEIKIIKLPICNESPFPFLAILQHQPLRYQTFDPAGFPGN